MIFELFDVSYWFLLPISIVIATIAMSTIATGAAFFTPIFILFLKLDPRVAIGAALLTQTAGFSAGFYFHAKSGNVNFKLVFNILKISIVGVILGLLLINFMPINVLKILLGLGIILIGLKLFFVPDRGSFYYSPTINPFDLRGVLTMFIGGITLGMLSIGLSELVGYHLDKKCMLPTKSAVATTVCLTAIATFIASIGHFYFFITAVSNDSLFQIFNIVKFTIPAVILGAFFGKKINDSLSSDKLRKFGALMLLLMGIILFIYSII